MITGAVKSDEARIRLKVTGRRRREHEVEAVIDSGYSGSLTLPPALIKSLGLRWRSVDRATLADGSTCVFQAFVGRCSGTAKCAPLSSPKQMWTPSSACGCCEGTN
jgi:predicted aspartyl protease